MWTLIIIQGTTQTPMKLAPHQIRPTLKAEGLCKASIEAIIQGDRIAHPDRPRSYYLADPEGN